ncbi:putative Anaphase-promoting complex subunit 8 [Glarea lozoyensis 74030]|uniref:Putative Anaphase-promoting complex subunit 8 n=1 Tax=Glarea lozoyensis (strain ATCC 74030 / MF5533) TaxID=1104152 RepID=H0EH95_GLAL7|nr:putative Anaphase-promoting complex subunit 8 [Glarea lozoyensis 74030]
MSGEKKKDEDSEMVMGPHDGGTAVNKQLVVISRYLKNWFDQHTNEAGDLIGGQGWLEYLAVDVNRRDYRAWYGLGQTYEVLEMHAYALWYYKRAAGLRPWDGKMWMAVGSCLQKMGRNLEGIKALKRALLAESYYEAGVGSSFGSGERERGGLMDPEILLQIAGMYEGLEDEAEARAYMEMCVAQEEGSGVGLDSSTINIHTDSQSSDDESRPVANTSSGETGTGVTAATSKARMWLANRILPNHHSHNNQHHTRPPCLLHTIPRVPIPRYPPDDRAQLVSDPEEKIWAMELITNSVLPNRWSNTRLPPNAAEMSSTQILRVSIHSGSAKVREGVPNDEKADIENEELLNEVWTGVIPVYENFGKPVPGPYNRVSVPEHVRVREEWNERNERYAREAAGKDAPVAGKKKEAEGDD